MKKNMMGMEIKGKYRGKKKKWLEYRLEGDESEIEINKKKGGKNDELD